MKTIEVLISTTGEIKLNAKGFSGVECEKATAELEKELGSTGRRKKKPEYFEKTTQRQTTKA